MGRGPHDHQAVMSAQSLLFGPRRSRQEAPAPVQKEKKSEMAKMGKKRARERRKDDYAKAFSDAGDEAERGNFAPLGALSETQQGLKMVERRSLRLLADQLSMISNKLLISSLSDNPLMGDQLISGEGDLQSFLVLQEKMEGHNMPDKVMIKIARTISTNVMLSSSIKIMKELLDKKDEIGPLPEVIMGNDYGQHLLKDGKTICGMERFDFTGRAYPSARVSILSQRLTCHNCLDHRKEADLLAPDEWASLIEEQRPGNWPSWSRPLYLGEGSAAELIKSSETALRSSVNGNLDSAGLPDIF